MCALEVLDGRTNSSLELNNRRTVVRRLVVDDDIELHALVLNDSLDGGEGDIHRVGVEVLEFAHALKVLDVLARDLGDFEQAHLALVLDDGTTLNVCLGLVREFHKEFGFRADEVGKDPEIYIGAQVVDIGHKDVLLASGNELVQKARVAERIEDVAVPRWVPLRLVRGCVPRYGEERFLVDTWVPRLVEGEDLDVMVCVLLNDALRVLVRVERIHENERYIDAVHFVKVLRRWRLVMDHGTMEPNSPPQSVGRTSRGKSSLRGLQGPT